MDTKTALLNCAEDAVRARGYDGFSYADLADGVGIRKASVHHHFPTKADLATAMIERYVARLRSLLEDFSAEHATGGARLAAYAATNRAVIDGGNKLCLCVAFSVASEGLDSPILNQIDHFHEMAAHWLAESFRMGLDDGSIAAVTDPETEALACLAQMEGAQLMARAARDAARFDGAVANLLQRIR